MKQSKSIEPIECSFRKLSNYPEEGTRVGRYDGSFRWDIPEFSDTKWVVLGYLDVDWYKIMENEFRSKDEIVAGCLKYLNTVPERKKHAKKDPKPKYGLLEAYKVDLKVKAGKYFMIVQFKTNERNNPNFWGEGQSWNGTRTPKKRGRPPKIKAEQD